MRNESQDKREPAAEDGGGEEKLRMTRKDILAVSIALLQLFFPAILGLVLVGVVVALILR